MNNSIQKNLDFIKRPHVQIFLDVFRILSVTSLILSLFGFFFYTVGYSFLYGYYISGNESSFVSTLNVITNPVPFNYYTVLIISSLLMISVIFLISAVFVYKKKKVHLSLATSVFILVFHVCLSTFFTNGQEIPNRALSFIIVWAVPIFITIMVFWMVKAPTRIGTSISGSLYGAIIPAVLFVFFDFQDILVQLILPLSTFLVGIIFTFLKEQWFKKYIFRFLIFFPYIFTGCIIIVIVIQNLLQFEINNTIRFVLLLSSLLINIVISFRKIKIQQNDSTSGENEGKTKYEQYFKPLEEAGKASVIATITLVVVALGILTPYIAVIGGQYIRDVSDSNRQLHIIQNDRGMILSKGTIISVKDGVYYISDENWKLTIVKGDNIIVVDSKK
ncbi:hypothetical protein ASD24_10335 [Paenibacillus sp. Root52]|uniref:hypothetical protein n=1 Tax=Paenibacillus sp. Root52 TaxID=1736552 RepID=UPI0006FCFE71|nr:hypothetical protein [Paenibacillus sp. Root52]KQY84170.1 hypothetical protein ASD24_10335 [Paenibacillus sp. Root52]